MARKISFTKAEMEAVAECLKIERYGVPEDKKAGPREKALRTLYGKMQKASLPEEKKHAGNSGSIFAGAWDAVFPGGAIWPDTPRGWVEFHRAINEHQTLASVDAAQDLAAACKTWAKRPISWRTIVNKGGEWLRAAKAIQGATPRIFMLPEDDE